MFNESFVFNIINMLVMVLIAYFALRIGYETGFPRLWKITSAGFLVIGLGRAILAVNEFGYIKFPDLGVLLIILGSILVMFGLALFFNLLKKPQGDKK